MSKQIDGTIATHKLANAMTSKINTSKNLSKHHWRDSTTGHLVKRMLEEIEELTEALNNGTIEDIESECADVGNFLMMIFDNEVLNKGD